jgi:signal transduction histidine kinase
MFGYSALQVLLTMYGWLIFGLLITAIVLVIVWIGLPILLVVLAMLRGYADLHRRLDSRILGTPIPPPYRRQVDAGGVFFVRLRMRLTDPATWRDCVWLLEVQSLGFALHLAAFVAFPILPIGYWGSPLLMRMQASITRVLIGPTDEKELHQRIGQLETSRAATVDHSAAELRRIERDLHDGAQARLVALGMNLGLAEELVTRDPGAAAELIAEARASSSTALSELRSLVRGIHPPVLADRGLSGGIEALALTHSGPVDVDVQLPGRPPAPVESAVYFAVAEAITNAAKYAAGASLWIWGRYDLEAAGQGHLRITVADDGAGGATMPPDGGLAGLAQRLEAFDGRLTLASPAGAGTVITIDVPCTLQAVQAGPPAR